MHTRVDTHTRARVQTDEAWARHVGAVARRDMARREAGRGEAGRGGVGTDTDSQSVWAYTRMRTTHIHVHCARRACSPWTSIGSDTASQLLSLICSCRHRYSIGIDIHRRCPPFLSYLLPWCFCLPSFVLCFLPPFIIPCHVHVHKHAYVRECVVDLCMTGCGPHKSSGCRLRQRNEFGAHQGSLLAAAHR